LQFIYCSRASDSRIELDGELFNYIFKVRRHRQNELLFLRNPQNPKILYKYEIIEIKKRKATLNYLSHEENFVNFEKDIIVGWCVVDSKIIEKTLPMLNELGAKTLSLIYCDFSQRNFTIDEKRINRILETSSMQCGRADFLQIETFQNIDTFLEKYPNAFAIDFGGKDNFHKNLKIEFVVGSEGGFSERERNLFKEKFALPSPYILRSETAVISTLTKFL
jgi:16S rRNA (uracil1498-N3)-methyltransferase